MIDEIDPEKFVMEIFGCKPGDVSETVILTPGRKFLDGLKEKVDVQKELRVSSKALQDATTEIHSRRFES